MAIGMEGEMTRAVARGKGNDAACRRRGQLSGCGVEPVDVDPVLSQVSCEDEFILGVGGNHVCVRSIVAADGKAATWGVRGMS